MGEAEWSFMEDGLDAPSLDRGTTTGIVRPNGGGSFVFGFNSLVVAEGAAAMFGIQANFAPTPANKGGRVTGAIKRMISAGLTGFAPFFMIQAQGESVNDNAYLLGLSDDSPYRIALRKGKIAQGIPAALPGASGILRRSTDTFLPDVWLQLRVDCVVNLNGDVILKVWQSDVLANPVTAPVWTPVAGIEDSSLIGSHGAGTAFVDDALGINSGSQPYTSGRMGLGFYTKEISRRAAFDQVELIRQT